MDLAIYSFFRNFLNRKADKAVGQIISVVCMDNYVPDGTLPCDGSYHNKRDFLLLWNKYLIGTKPTYYAWVCTNPALTVWTKTPTPISYETSPLLGHAKYTDNNYAITNVGSETQITVSSTIDGITTQYVCTRQRSLDENNHLLPTCSEIEYSQFISLYGQCPFWTVDTASGTFRTPYIKNGSVIQQALLGAELGKVFDAGLPNITGFHADDTNINDSGVGGAFYRGNRTSNQSADGGGSAQNIMFDASRCSSVYGKSNTVQPQAITARFFVVV